MVTQKMAHKKVSFWTEIFMTRDTPICPKFAYFCFIK